jgi:hypothetical protein
MTHASQERGEDAASGTGPGMTPDLAITRLLRWYPRAWRERYGDEFLAMVEDTLDGRRPGWRLHLGVAWAGLRERARRARPAALRRMMAHDRHRPLHPGRHARDTSPKSVSWLSTVGAAALVSLFWFGQNLALAPFWADARRHARGAAAADVMTGLFVAVGASVAVAALAAGPALARFLRAGSWPGVRRPVIQVAVATVVAVAVLTQYILMARSTTSGHLVGSVPSLARLIAVLVSLEAAERFWRKAATTMAGQLELGPRVRAVQVVLNAVVAAAVHAMLPVVLIWIGQVTANGWTFAFGVLLLTGCLSDLGRLWWACRQAQRLRAATAGGGEGGEMATPFGME